VNSHEEIALNIYPSCEELAFQLAPLYKDHVEDQGRLKIDLLERSMTLDTVFSMPHAFCKREPELSEPEFKFSCMVHGKALVHFLKSARLEALLQRAYIGTTESTDGDKRQVHLTDDAKVALDEIRMLILSEIDLNTHALVRIVQVSSFVDMDNDYHEWWGEDESLMWAVDQLQFEMMSENEIDTSYRGLIIDVDLRNEFLEAALIRFCNDPTSPHLYCSHVEALVDAGYIDQEDADEWKQDCGERD
jgi:hypothetical protein